MRTRLRLDTYIARGPGLAARHPRPGPTRWMVPGVSVPRRAPTALVGLIALVALGCNEAPPPTSPLIAPPAQPEFSLVVTGTTVLGSFGGDFNRAHGINNLGQIVGTTSNTLQQLRAFRWENGSMVNLGSFAGNVSGALDINDVGQIVGTSWIAIHEDRAFLWENGVMMELGTLGGTFSFASAVNAHGQVVGSSRDGDEVQRAFVWQHGEMAPLSTPPGHMSLASGINDLGQIVGASGPTFATLRATLWDDGAPIDLGTLGGPASSAADINNVGQVVGRRTDEISGLRPFLWENGVMVDLETPPQAIGDASAINDLGQVVGLVLAAGGRRAVLWMDGKRFELGGIEGGESEAIAINNLGEVVGFTVSGNVSQAVRWQVVLRATIEPDATVRLNGGGTVSVTVLGSKYFDAGMIDPLTTTLGDEIGGDTPVARRPNGQPRAVLRDVNRDGHPDLVLEFDKRQMVANGDLGPSTTQWVLSGGRIDGRRVRGVAPVAVQ